MENKKYNSFLVIFNTLFFIIAALFMYDFYKALSGFIANNFEDGIKMIAIISSYLLPVIWYLYFIYSFYYKKNKKITSFIFSIIFIIWAIFNIVSILINISLYISNNTLGVYDVMPSVFNLFPYDMLAINIIIAVIGILNIINMYKKINGIDMFIESYRLNGVLSFKLYEYILISILSILAFVFVGAFINSFNAIENISYDPKYIYLMLWALLVPLSSLFLFVLKLENRFKNKKDKIIYLCVVIAINVIFTALLFIFEAIYPNFITYIGKPIFAIAFSVSLPIEMLILIFMSLLTSIFSIIKLIKIIK